MKNLTKVLSLGILSLAVSTSAFAAKSEPEYLDPNPAAQTVKKEHQANKHDKKDCNKQSKKQSKMNKEQHNARPQV
ncbi:hypothetical protein [Moraxella pluranimalium]|uniref:Acid-shock protein n=1 Tax=Moraxella pluranimalium TaxID=470453 RepID=A0A1T0CRZ6_9GAMM|nr:hypothetical protein [Moraxella pluranimalium]OOS25116.1 hypothetical protein B0680_03170 [Moraxella pluranimalium]